MDASGRILLEAAAPSDPDAISRCLAPYGAELKLVAFKAGPLSEWLYRGLQDAGITAVLMDTRHVRAALSAMVMKADRNDARGVAQLLRSGWFRPVHVKAVPAREQRAL